MATAVKFVAQEEQRVLAQRQLGGAVILHHLAPGGEREQRGGFLPPLDAREQGERLFAQAADRP